MLSWGFHLVKPVVWEIGFQVFFVEYLVVSFLWNKLILLLNLLITQLSLCFLLWTKGWSCLLFFVWSWKGLRLFSGSKISFVWGLYDLMNLFHISLPSSWVFYALVCTSIFLLCLQFWLGKLEFSSPIWFGGRCIASLFEDLDFKLIKKKSFAFFFLFVFFLYFLIIVFC